MSTFTGSIGFDHHGSFEINPKVTDHWMNRAGKMRCQACMWWVRKGATELGRCRRHAPTTSGFPAVYGDDWCGDRKLDEAKA